MIQEFFVLSFENDNGQETYKRYYLQIKEIKDYNVLINGRFVFDHQEKNELTAYDKIPKNATGQGDN